MNTKKSPRVAFAGGTAAALLFLSLPLHADALTFTVDPTRSALTLSGSAFALPFTPQGGNAQALVTSYAGTIQANLSAGVLTFTGGSAITGQLNPGHPFTPAGTGTDNYGVAASGFVPGFGVATISGAYRDFTLDITAGTAQNGLAAAGMSLSLTAGKLDYSGSLSGTSSLVGAGGANTSAGLVSLTSAGGFDTLSLPVHFQITGSNRVQEWDGTLVAVAPVPEPSSLAFIGLGLAGLAYGARRQSARV